MILDSLNSILSAIRENFRYILFIWIFLSLAFFVFSFTFIFKDDKSNIIRQPVIFSESLTNLNKFSYYQNQLSKNKADQDNSFTRLMDIDNNFLIRNENIEKALNESNLKIEPNSISKNLSFISGQSEVNIFKDYFSDMNIVPLIKRLSIDAKEFDKLIIKSISMSKPLNELVLDLNGLAIGKTEGRIFLNNIIKVMNEDLKNKYIYTDGLKKVKKISLNGSDTQESALAMNLKIQQVSNMINEIKLNYSNVVNDINPDDLILDLKVLEKNVINYYTQIGYDQIYINQLDIEIKDKTRRAEIIYKAIISLNDDNKNLSNILSENGDNLSENGSIRYDGDAIAKIEELSSKRSSFNYKKTLTDEFINRNMDLSDLILQKDNFMIAQGNSKTNNDQISSQNLIKSINNSIEDVNKYIDVISNYENQNIITSASSIISEEYNKYSLINLVIFILASMILFLLSSLIIFFVIHRRN